jgi:hypothetical protein
MPSTARPGFHASPFFMIKNEYQREKPALLWWREVEMADSSPQGAKQHT